MVVVAEHSVSRPERAVWNCAENACENVQLGSAMEFGYKLDALMKRERPLRASKNQNRNLRSSLIGSRNDIRANPSLNWLFCEHRSFFLGNFLLKSSDCLSTRETKLEICMYI